LASYPDDGPPVVVDYYPSNSNKNPESTSANDMDEEDGTSESPCSFVVHGLTSEEFSTKTMKTIKTIALGGVGHCFAWHVQVSLGFYSILKQKNLYIVCCVQCDIWGITAPE
jgi:hypothetical protein